jgi:hypothetical protein
MFYSFKSFVGANRGKNTSRRIRRPQPSIIFVVEGTNLATDLNRHSVTTQVPTLFHVTASEYFCRNWTPLLALWVPPFNGGAGYSADGNGACRPRVATRVHGRLPHCARSPQATVLACSCRVLPRAILFRPFGAGRCGNRTANELAVARGGSATDLDKTAKKVWAAKRGYS